MGEYALTDSGWDFTLETGSKKTQLEWSLLERWENMATNLGKIWDGNHGKSA